ncbi:hypothetical protein [Rhodanobacter lindaniclasticus]
MIAYCWASGQIEFGARTPPGAIPIARGSARIVRAEMEVTARHGYKAGVLLVPGIPEAADQQQAGSALELFLLWLKQRERKGFRVAIKPRDPFDYDMCGQTVSHLDVDSRCRAVATFDKAACMHALLVPSLQGTVRKAVDRRLRQLLKAEVIA